MLLTSHKYKRCFRQNRGSALFIVLGCVALMTLLVVAFLGSAIAERSTSDFYAKEVNSKLLSENAVNMILAQLRTATKSVSPLTGATVAWASQPGMIRAYDANGNPDSYYKLYSWDNMVGKGQYTGGDLPDGNWASEPELYIDLNEAINSHNPIVSAHDANGNPLVSMTVDGHAGVLTYNSTGASTPDVEGFFVDPSSTPLHADNQVPMPVKWIYILSDGTQVIPTANGTSGVKINGATAANPIVGRIAFWTDDETSKVNINTASEGSNWDVPLTWATEDYGSYKADGATFAAPFGMATAVPAGGEYQRIPGHPATTCLSTVFGSVLPTPLPPLTESSYDSNLAPYFTLTPRYAPGGSKAGTRASYNSADVNYDSQGFLIPPAYRLYTSPDELMFDPQRIPIATANPNVYADSSNGISPAGGRTAIAMNQNFFSETQFFLTTNSKAPEETLFDTPRISLWPIQTDSTHARNVKDNLLAFCSTINGNPYYFQRAGFYASSKGSSFNLGGPAGSAAGSSQDMAIDMGGSTSASGIVTPGTPDASANYTGNAIPTKRNQNLLAYLRALTSADGVSRNIPGFGGNFMTKYPVPSNGSVSDLDQILVDIFDYIRSSVNTYSLGYTPQYTVTPMSLSGAWQPGSGSVLPIQVNINGHTVAGLGRTTAIAEIALIFMPAGFLDGTTLGTSSSTVPPYAPTAGPDGLPDEVLSTTGTYQTGTSSTGSIVGIGSPQTTKMQAFIVIRPVGVTPSTTGVSPNLRYSVAGLDSWYVDFSGGTNPLSGGSAVNLGFPSGGAVPGAGNPGSNAGSQAVDLMNPSYGSRGPLGWSFQPLICPIPDASYSPHRLRGTSNGDNTTANQQIYPLAGTVISLPSPANPSAWGGSDGKQLLRPGMKPNTFSFSGGNIAITVSSGFPTSGATAPVIQTVNLRFPPINSLPIPSYVRANPNDNGYGNGVDGGYNSQAPYYYPNQFTDVTKLEFYTQIHLSSGYAADTGNIGDFPERIGNQAQSGSGSSYNINQLIQRGDTVRSLVLNPNSIIHGDLRIVANLAVVPLQMNGDAQYVYNYLGTNLTKDSQNNTLYPANAAYDANFNQFHSLYLDTGNYYSYETRTVSVSNVLSPNISDTAPVNWQNYTIGGGAPGQGTFGGALFSGATYYSCVTPGVTPELIGTYMDSSNSIAGDWSTGVGNTPDGPMVITPDEGYQNQNGSGYSSPYYETSGGGVAGAASTFSSESFSPNRQIASAVMFGTIPACVQSGQPWRTLLFCPNPAAGSKHPGFGVGSGTPGPNDFAPYTTPPDHLFLDLFWMPIIDPYAISEPFATAGKVNMNYQIVPFSYIHRSTAVRAVLKSIGLLALPPKASPPQPPPYQSISGPEYKSYSYHFQNIPAAQNDNYRYNINLDETVDALDSGFQARFALNDIFHSASEICNIFLVPQAIPGNTYNSAGGNTPPATYSATAAWWKNFQLTGDNAREAPYNKIYPRLTTKSNTFQVYFRVQTLVKNHRSGTLETVFDTTKGDAIGGEFRGSAIIERYIDPNDTTLPDFATAYPNSGTTLDNYYRFRVVRSKSFTP